MSRTFEKVIGEQTFTFLALPASVAMRHATRAGAIWGAARKANEEGGIGAMMVALGEKLPAAEFDFFSKLCLFDCDERCQVEGKPLKVAMDAGLVKGGVPAVYQALIAAMDGSFGPFGDLAGMFVVLVPPEELKKLVDAASKSSE